ncbi:DUF5666 domain-containing protein [Mycobacterium sp. UM_Kg1]|uniref:DUF5666 domain-containing protein n=1 Tax=Mycobacterium sp. UM_Kg1 TaxID=1545691 RepID=UPI00061B3993|nr:DUF5666 domain-containing protein [Mycobacterium sp. UM_Kg1]
MSPRPSTPGPTIRALAGATALFAGALFIPALAHAQPDRVMGTVSSASGTGFEVTGPNGPTTVAVTDSTSVYESVPAQRGEITVGSCIKAGGAAADEGPLTAKFVSISTTVDGACPQRPAASGDGTAHPASHRGVRGVVESISGDTLTVSGPSGPATVTLDDATRFRRTVAVSAPSISAGKCVAAGGTTDDQGVLQAKRVTVWAANGDCLERPA